MNEIIQKGKPWTDPDFPPKLKSLFDPAIDKGDKSKFAAYEWKRASECYDNPKVFDDAIEPNDIN